MNDAVLSVENFHKSYKNVVAVENISFQVQRGEIFGLLGPNGAGKTTTLECLEGLRRPDSGRLQVAGIDPTRQFSQLRDVIGVQLQTSGLPATITVEESIRFFSSYHKVQPNYDLIDRLDLGQKRRAQYQELSTGQQRRLSLILAVVHQPEVLFLDEPTAGLDVASRVSLHELMNELKASGTTMILATHDMAEAEEMSDRIAILLSGKIAVTGTPLEITASGAGFTKITVRTQNNCLEESDLTFPAVDRQFMKEEYMVYFSTNIGSTVSAIITGIESHGDKLIDLRIERPSLEDRFLEITKVGGVQ